MEGQGKARVGPGRFGARVWIRCHRQEGDEQMRLLTTGAGLMLALAVVTAGPGLAADGPAAARPDPVPGWLDSARAAHARGDLARAAHDLEAAVSDLQTRIGTQLAASLPPPPSGWQAEAAETQSLFSSGGGLSVGRAFTREDASVNVLLILDSPAVAAAAAQFQPGAPLAANVRRVKVAGEEALVRWDGGTHSGDVTLVLGGRALLQVEGDGVASSDLLLDTAKGWNLGVIRKLLGM